MSDYEDHDVVKALREKVVREVAEEKQGFFSEFTEEDKEQFLNDFPIETLEEPARSIMEYFREMRRIQAEMDACIRGAAIKLKLFKKGE